jgi:hypothetical protein
MYWGLTKGGRWNDTLFRKPFRRAKRILVWADLRGVGLHFLVMLVICYP